MARAVAAEVLTRSSRCGSANGHQKEWQPSQALMVKRLFAIGCRVPLPVRGGRSQGFCTRHRRPERRRSCVCRRLRTRRRRVHGRPARSRTTQPRARTGRGYAAFGEPCHGRMTERDLARRHVLFLALVIAEGNPRRRCRCGRPGMEVPASIALHDVRRRASRSTAFSCRMVRRGHNWAPDAA